MTAKPILLVEDNPSDVDLTKRAFEKSRIANRLAAVEDGQEALDCLFGGPGPDVSEEAERPALIVLDLKLPKVGGLEVLRRIRQDPRTRRMPVVILTASREERDLAAGCDVGVNSHIRKPVDFQRFVNSVQQLGLCWPVLNEPPPEGE